MAVTASSADLDTRGDDDDFALSGLGFGLPRTEMPQWAGALVRLPGAWLPALAILPRQHRDVDDPKTRWPSESEEFRRRFSVHAEDLRTASDLLSPAVLAVALDRVPGGSAITLSGDALQLWWPHRRPATTDLGRVARACTAARHLADTIPSFVLSDHPDRSEALEQSLAERRAAAIAYRAARDARGVH